MKGRVERNKKMEKDARQTPEYFPPYKIGNKQKKINSNEKMSMNYSKFASKLEKIIVLPRFL